MIEWKNLRGKESLIAFRQATADIEIINLMETVLTKTYEKFFGQDGKQFVNRVFAKIMKLPVDSNMEQFIDSIVSNRATFEEAGLGQKYRSQFRIQNLLKSIKVIGINKFKGIVVDVGCDDNKLGNVLLDPKNKTQVTKVIGTDVDNRVNAYFDKNLEFRLEENPPNLPIKDEEADTIIIRSALHHMPISDQVTMVEELKRILAPEGTVLIYADSYSTKFEPESNENDEEIHAKFLSLGSSKRLNLFLATMDTFSFSIKEKDQPFPFTFREVEDWIQLFKNKGFKVDKKYYGYPLFDLHQRSSLKPN